MLLTEIKCLDGHLHLLLMLQLLGTLWLSVVDEMSSEFILCLWWLKFTEKACWKD